MDVLDTADCSARTLCMFLLYMPGSVGFSVTDAVLLSTLYGVRIGTCFFAGIMPTPLQMLLRLRSAQLTTARMRQPCRLFEQLISTQNMDEHGYQSQIILLLYWRIHAWCERCCDCCQYSFGIATMTWSRTKSACSLASRSLFSGVSSDAVLPPFCHSSHMRS